MDAHEEWALDTKRMIDAEGGTSEVFIADVTREDSVKLAVEKIVRAFGAIHVLVNIGILELSHRR